MTDQERTEDLAQLLDRLKSKHGVSGSEIARRIGVSHSAVSSWINRTRGTGRGPSQDNLLALHAAFPDFTRDEIFKAARRQSPGPHSPEARQRVIEIYERLTAEQQKSFEAQMLAVDEMNRTGQ